MLESLLITINSWITQDTGFAYIGSFLWGMVSVVFSPCHLAAIPLIVAYVGGQNRILDSREAGTYSLLFSLGLFITIAAIGAACAALGRVLGDVGGYWQIIIGAILIWVALGMMGVPQCSLPGNFLHRFKLRGHMGALGLGLGYGVLSGMCTFGFLAPILAIITIQEKVATGIVMIILFALGHCLPILVAGCSAALARRVTELKAWHGAGTWFRKGAGILILILGVYFILNPFFS
ncbi:cytochrome c biogenesis CcdA family protein [Desulfonatronovibrio hydrogenovorans]|uniref:cytochrome c biogenesis CcdA family protein n=1 Tax=Desulfonatronovibrio hydrogenovorans TaxID=53245 RepID=UPI00048F2EE8|nr:cytochrome c biogenesis protein CcdA [Desulfonatronovibrio hydrogenovorans]